MNHSTSNSNRNILLLFLAWPFFAVSYAIRNYRATWAKNIIWLFVIFYGYTLTIHNYDEEKTIDANRYRNKFVEMAKQPITFGNFAALLYTGDDNIQTLDVIETAVIFLLSRVTDNYHVLFAVFGLILGYFYSRNIWYLIEKAGRGITRTNIPVIFTFAFIVGFWEINGFRFWSAAHIFLYGALPFLFEGKKKRVWFCVLSVFMHFSFFMPLAILGIYLLAGRQTKIYFILFIITLFIREINVSQLGEFLSNNLPDIFLPKVKGYTSEEYAEGLTETIEKANWYAVIYGDVLKWTITAFIILIYAKGSKFISINKGFSSLFSFTLLLYSIANVLSLVPSGGRFVTLSNLFSMAIVFLYIQYAPRGKAVKRLISFAIPAMIFYSLITIRIAFETMGFFSVFGNPFLSVFIDVDLTLIEVVKSMLGVPLK